MATAEQTGDGPKHQYRMERRRIQAAPHVDGMTRGDADRLLEFLDALDPENYTVQPGDIGTKSYSTLAAYGQNLRLLVGAAAAPLEELTAGQLNQVFSDMDLSQNTVVQRQTAARVFYRYHADLGVDPELITIDRSDRSAVQPRDLFTREEIDAMRAEMDNARDRAMVDLMLYTGQRVRAIQTLRVGDIDLENKRFYLNTDEAGLKGAKGMRPMTLAHDACKTWMENHPASDDPDAYFITKLPGSNRGDVHTALQHSTVYRRIQGIAEAAGIDRWKARGHPHNFRHTFVRWAYINKGMDIPEIKYMMGHAKDSTTLENTYMNIFESDFARKVEQKAGTEPVDEPEDELSPEVCKFCDYAPLPKNARSCPNCTNLLSPADAMKQQELQQQLAGLMEQIENADEGAAAAVMSRALLGTPPDELEG